MHGGLGEALACTDVDRGNQCADACRDVDDQAAKTVNRNYQGNFERMVKVKNRYDPTNLFRLNANVKPTV